MSNTKNLTLLGKKTTYKLDKPDANILETFDNIASHLVVPFQCHEFTSICPMTGQPDFGRFEITYIPDKKCIESKSLKLYLFSFRNHGEFHEDVTNRIMEDIFTKTNPLFIRVWGNFNVRGGIALKPMALKFRDGLSKEEKEDIKIKMENYDRVKV
jgi:7-cyano-7-deazaguanine reductase